MSAKSPKLIIGVSFLALLGVAVIFGGIFVLYQVTKRAWLNPSLITSYHDKAWNSMTSSNWDEAIKYLDAAIALNRNDSWAYTGRGHAYGMKGDHKQAMLDFSKAIELNASDPWPYAYRGKDYSLQHDLDHALADYDRAIRLSIKKQNGADAYVAALEFRSSLYVQKEEWSNALEDLSQLTRSKHGDFRIYNNRAYVLDHLGRYTEAISNLNIGLKLNPTNMTAYARLGICRSHQGYYKKAIAAYAAALKMQPDNPLVLNNFAWLLATCPEAEYRNGKEAVAKASKSCELSGWKEWHPVGTLAASYAEIGDFENAVKYQQQTLTMEGLTDKERDDANEELKLYEARKPYREEQNKNKSD